MKVIAGTKEVERIDKFTWKTVLIYVVLTIFCVLIVLPLVIVFSSFIV